MIDSLLPPLAVGHVRAPADPPRDRSPLRILLAEDDPSTSDAVIGELANACPGSVVERVESKDRFERALRELRPDVVLVDDALGWLDVRAALGLVQEMRPASPLIVLARALDQEALVGGLRAGAEAFVFMADLRWLRRAVDTALSVRRPLRKLSPRQLDVLRLIAAGHTTPSIANRLERSPKTIETHRSEIMKRLGIHDLVGLVRYAIRVGLLPPEVQTR